MKASWIGACVALPVAAAPLSAQVQVDPAGQPGSWAQAPAPAPAPETSAGTPRPRPRPGPDPRDQILRDMLEGVIRDVVTPPSRPAPPPEPFEPAEIELPGPIAEPTPVPTPPRRVPTPPPPRRTPRPELAPEVVERNPAPPVMSEPPLQSRPPAAAVPRPAAEAPPAPISSIAAPEPVPVPVPGQTRPAPAATAPEAVESAQPTLGAAALAWWPLALLLAVAAAGAAEWTRRQRRLARTRAALMLEPRLDEVEGEVSAGPVQFAAPPLSIRCRLEEGMARA